MQEFIFKVLRVPSQNPEHPEGDFHLLGKNPDHYTPMHEINDKVGKEVLALRGHGMGVNLVIEDMQAWSDYVSMHVEELVNEPGYFKVKLPDGILVNRYKENLEC